MNGVELIDELICKVDEGKFKSMEDEVCFLSKILCGAIAKVLQIRHERSKGAEYAINNT